MFVKGGMTAIDLRPFETVPAAATTDTNGAAKNGDLNVSSSDAEKSKVSYFGIHLTGSGDLFPEYELPRATTACGFGNDNLFEHESESMELSSVSPRPKLGIEPRQKPKAPHQAIDDWNADPELLFQLGDNLTHDHLVVEVEGFYADLPVAPKGAVDVNGKQVADDQELSKATHQISQKISAHYANPQYSEQLMRSHKPSRHRRNPNPSTLDCELFYLTCPLFCSKKISSFS